MEEQEEEGGGEAGKREEVGGRKRMEGVAKELELVSVEEGRKAREREFLRGPLLADTPPPLHPSITRG